MAQSNLLSQNNGSIFLSPSRNYLCVLTVYLCLPHILSKLDSYHVGCSAARVYLHMKIGFGLLSIAVTLSQLICVPVVQHTQRMDMMEFNSRIDLVRFLFSLVQTVVRSITLSIHHLYTLFKYVQRINA